MNLFRRTSNKRAAEEVGELLIHLHLQSAANGSTPRTTELLPQLLKKLSQNPRLTRLSYASAWRQRNVFPPIWHFLQVPNVPLDSLQSLCKLTSKGKLNADLQTWSLLHWACEDPNLAPEVMEFLARQAPYLLQSRAGRGHIPLHLAMQNNVPAGTLILLLELYPDPIQWHTTWSLAVLTGQPPELLEYMGRRYNSENLWLEDSRIPELLRLPMTAPRAHGFNSVLTRLDSVSFKTITWDVEGFTVFMQALETNTSISEVAFLKLPDLRDCSIGQQVPAWQAFRRMLQTNKALKSLGLQWVSEKDMAQWEMWLQMIQKELEGKVALSSLKLDVIWSNVVGTDHRKETTFQWMLWAGFERRKSYHLVNCDFRFHLKLIRRVFRSLDLLWLEVDTRNQNALNDSHREKLASGIVSLLSDSHVAVKELVLNNLNIDVVAVFDALRTNQSLQKFRALNWPDEEDESKSDRVTCACVDLLKLHNRTLTAASPWDSFDPRVQHYLQLNEMGRANAQAGEDMSQLLCNVFAKRIRDHGCPDQFLQNMLYGLLRESPGLWCHTAAWNSSLLAARCWPSSLETNSSSSSDSCMSACNDHFEATGKERAQQRRWCFLPFRRK
ncbi:expressed unknown protein [Seminavis robusta]|uniref:Uncharacterized protein n=1 Tax=Seminavis robusta TaxID=568900 RepID=A0A9N8EYU6_9STRA|nr:expressed unknown protein [Seminavis robusta]|eukprot:Sro2171_g317470.1 n/a (612) ;mRNA; r:7927-9762